MMLNVIIGYACNNKAATTKAHCMNICTYVYARLKPCMHASHAKCDWASKKGPSGHIKFDHIFQFW